jgi:hypothetical protein
MSRARRASMTLIALVLAGLAATSARAEESPGDDGPFHYFTVKPCRFLDTRLPGQGGPLITDEVIPAGSATTRLFKVRGTCGVPEGARALAMNITVPARNQTFFGHLIAFAAVSPAPGTSNLNFSPSTAIANFAIVKVGAHDLDLHHRDLAIRVVLADREVPSLGAPVELVLDVVGYVK